MESEQPDRRAEFARLLCAARGKSRLSRSAVARLIGVAPETLRTWEEAIFLPQQRIKVHELDVALATGGALERLLYDESELAPELPTLPSGELDLDMVHAEVNALGERVAVLKDALDKHSAARQSALPAEPQPAPARRSRKQAGGAGRRWSSCRRV